MKGETELYRKKKCWRCVKAGVQCSCAVSTIDFNLVLRPGKPAFLMGWDGQQVSQEQVVAAYHERMGRPLTPPGPRPSVAPRPLVLPLARRPPLSALSTLSPPQHPPSVRPPVDPPNAEPPGSSRPVPAAVHTAPIRASRRTSSVDGVSHGQGITPDGGAEKTPRTHEPDWWYHRASFIREAQQVGGVPLIKTFLTATGRGWEVGAGSISIHLNNIKRLLSQTGAELELVIEKLSAGHSPPHSTFDLERATRLREEIRRMEWDVFGAGSAPDESASVDGSASPSSNTTENDNGHTPQEPPQGSSTEKDVWRQELEGAIEALREEVRLLHARNSGNDSLREEHCESWAGTMSPGSGHIVWLTDNVEHA